MKIKKDYWLLFLSLAGWLAILLLLPEMPDSVPMHWNINGDVDRWGSKINMLWLGLLPAGIWALMTWIPKIDPKKANYEKFGSSYRIMRAVIVLFMIAVNWLTVIKVLYDSTNIVLFIKIFLGMLFTALGNLLIRIRPNWFTGIKTPWTLADPVIWKKTHRLGGYLMFFSGILFILSAFFLPDKSGFWVPMIFLIVSMFLTIIYSAVLWKKLHKDGTAGNSEN